jgi:hypothetical protein
VMLTVAPVWKPVPVIVALTVPEFTPVLGAIEVTVGASAATLNCVFRMGNSKATSKSRRTPVIRIRFII